MADPVMSQSVLATASDGAKLISELTWGLIIGGALLFVLVMLLLLRSLRPEARPVNANRWLIGGGVLLPVAVLTLLLGKGLSLGVALSHAPEIRGMEVEVVGRRWWWELRYRDAAGGEQVVLANELHLPIDCVAVLTLASDDVIHSFWVPALAGKVDLIPGKQNRLVIHATRTGRFRGQCAEYCGTQHANMGLEVVVESPEQFRAWLQHQAQPAAVPETALQSEGRDLFLATGCGGCHTVRGTAAAGKLGPDLTHVAGRRSLAAATLPNVPEAMTAWLRDAQHSKPGNLMPAMPQLREQQLRALSAYLASLN